MYLADRIAHCTHGVEIDLHGKAWSLPGPATFAERVRECPARYVLLEDVHEACCQLAERWSDLLDPVNPRLRAPMQDFWIEWSDPDTRERVGVLVRAEHSGRYGSLRAFWTKEDAVEVAQAEIVFDFDRALDFRRAHGSPRYGLRALPSPYDNLRPHLAVALDTPWAEYFRETALGPHGLPEASSACGERLWPDAIRALAFFVLLASAASVDQRTISKDRLNTARAKAGKRPLLDHVELRLGRPQAPSVEHLAGAGRKYPRMHMVRGHLVRRRDNLFWRAAHVRGGGQAMDAAPVTRHVRLA